MVYLVYIPVLGAEDTDMLGVYDTFDLALQAADLEMEGVKFPVWYSSEPMKGSPWRFPESEQTMVAFPVNDYEAITISQRIVQTSLKETT